MCFFFFFKQKTAYEMRISDWSSDVCSSDLAQGADDKCRNAEQKSEAEQRDVHLRQDGRQIAPVDGIEKNPRQQNATDRDLQQQKQEAAGKIGRASCRERGWQYVSKSVEAVSLKKKNAKKNFNNQH